MYRPAHFAMDDPERIRAVLRDHPLATLVVTDETDVPQATPVPVVADHTGEDGLRLRFHLARANPIADALASERPALLLFVGAEGYVSPDWYPTTPDLPPSWNYESIQARGVAREVAGDALRVLVGDLSALEEARLAPKPPWTDAKMGENRLRSMLRAIRGFALDAPDVTAKAKLSQNRSPADRAGVVAALDALGSERAGALAAAMRRSESSEGD